MDFERLNNWLSLLANIGVLAGIIFLAYELQQNTNIARSSAYGDTVQEINEWRSLVASDAELARIFPIYIADEVDTLNPIEGQRLRQLVAIILGIYENGYYSNQRGIMGDSEWLRLNVRACEHQERLARNSMDFSGILTEEFGNYLNNTCESR